MHKLLITMFFLTACEDKTTTTETTATPTTTETTIPTTEVVNSNKTTTGYKYKVFFIFSIFLIQNPEFPRRLNYNP